MCGITGAVWTDSKLAIDVPTLAQMTEVLRHRGPDDEGTYRCDVQIRDPYPTLPGVALGHRRLAIVDLEHSKQPMANEDGRIQVVFNGEIYNYVDLRRRLEGSGHVFRSAGDTETLVHLYEDEGADFLRHLVGMFALAIWDERHGRLLLARDRLGEKPLVYCHQPDRLLFASELKSLLQVPGMPRELDPSALDEYLTYQYVPHPNTIFRSIRKLPPGHYAVWEKGRLTVAPYWMPEWEREIDRPTADYIEEFRALLTESVRIRMHSDVPLGAFLSGGADSSSVVALMQQASARPIKTFSIGFPQPEYDETRYAATVAQHLGCEHEQLRIEPSALEILPQLVWHYDEPFGDSSAVPTFYLAKLTRQHVTVALTGDGGDELLAGYPRYRAVQLAAWFDRLPAGARRMLAAPLWQQIPAGGRQKSVLRRGKRFLDALAQSPQRRYGQWVSIFDEQRRAQLYSDAFLESLPDSDPLDFLQAAYDRIGRRDSITATTLVDLVTYLPCDLMTKVDIASMAHGLECRQPFLDHRLVELVAAMPLRLKMRRGRGKWILRRALGDLVPRAIFRRRKMGFGVPLDHWFRHELQEPARQVLLDPAALARGLFRPEAVHQLLQEHASGRFDHSARLWALLVLELWQQRWIDGRAPAGLAELSHRAML